MNGNKNFILHSNSEGEKFADNNNINNNSTTYDDGVKYQLINHKMLFFEQTFTNINLCQKYFLYQLKKLYLCSRKNNSASNITNNINNNNTLDDNYSSSTADWVFNYSNVNYTKFSNDVVFNNPINCFDIADPIQINGYLLYRNHVISKAANSLICKAKKLDNEEYYVAIIKRNF